MEATEIAGEVLIVEDNHTDVGLIREALREHGLTYRIVHARDGDAAISILNEIELNAARCCPAVMLLDWKLPRKSGAQVLRHVRSLKKCGPLPVIVVSACDLTEERELLANCGVCECFRKPMNLDEFLRIGELVRRVVNAGEPIR